MTFSFLLNSFCYQTPTRTHADRQLRRLDHRDHRDPAQQASFVLFVLDAADAEQVAHRSSEARSKQQGRPGPTEALHFAGKSVSRSDDVTCCRMKSVSLTRIRAEPSRAESSRVAQSSLCLSGEELPRRFLNTSSVKTKVMCSFK